MVPGEDPMIVLAKIAVMHFLLPGILSLLIANGLRKLGWIKPGDMKLDM